MVVEGELSKEIYKNKGELAMFSDIGMGPLAEEIEDAVKSCNRLQIKISWDQAATPRP